MQKYVVIKDGSDIIEKRAYAGDTSNLEESLKAEGVQYEMYDENDSIYSNAPVKQKSVSDWSKLTTLDDKVSYLAKLLGVA